MKILGNPIQSTASPTPPINGHKKAVRTSCGGGLDINHHETFARFPHHHAKDPRIDAAVADDRC